MAKKKAVRKTAPTKPAPPAFPGRTLQENLRSDIVRPVQNVLGIKADGWYGRKTLEAVAAFQSKNSLQCTGVVDKITWDTLFR